LVVSNIIITFEVVSLFSQLNSPEFFIIVQGGVVLVSFFSCLFLKKKNHEEKLSIKAFFINLFDFLKENRLITFGLFIILISYIGLAILSTQIPQNTSDSLYNHLSRIGHWLQQGNLNPYPSFSQIGITYPYNNSLLMMWSILFLGVDKYVGFVQWSGLVFLSLAIFGVARLFSFNRSKAAFSAIIFLTFPIVTFESITAQNDILVAAFVLIGLYFLIVGFRKSQFQPLFFASMSFALAIGTKQTALFLVPGFLIIFFYLLFQSRKEIRLKLGLFSFISLMMLTLLLGSYAYVQNEVVYKNPTGIQGYSFTKLPEIPRLVLINSTRLFTQFISCEGLPVPIEDTCLTIKQGVFRQILQKMEIDIESNDYLNSLPCGNQCFVLGYRYPFQEESSWYGFQSWGLIILSSIIGLIKSIKNKSPLLILLLISVAIAIFINVIYKPSWEPYQGRYFIVLVALLTPQLSYLYKKEKFIGVISGLITFLSLFILVFSIMNNDSKPLICKSSINEIRVWGKENSVLVRKVAAHLIPLVRNTYCLSDYTNFELRTFFTTYMRDPLNLVESNTPANSKIAIITFNGLLIDDYLFFGPNFQRKVYDFPEEFSKEEIMEIIKEYHIEYILLNSERMNLTNTNYQLVSEKGKWQLFWVNK
jgi:hypothetical protein